MSKEKQSSPNLNNQHFVSQFYLRRFSSNPHSSKKKQKVYVFDKGINNWRDTPEKIKGVASSHKFYSVGNSASIETSISKAERVFGEASKKVIDTESLAHSVQLRLDLANFISLQYFRTLRTREQLQHQLGVVAKNPQHLAQEEFKMWQNYVYAALVEFRLNAVKKQVVEAKRSNYSEERFGRTTTLMSEGLKLLENSVLAGNLNPLVHSELYRSEEFLKLFHLQLFYGFARTLMLKIVNMHWLLISRSEESPIVTSDHPTIVFKDAAPILAGKLTVEEITSLLTGKIDFDVQKYKPDTCLILFPISPKYLIALMGKSILQREAIFVAPESIRIDSFANSNNRFQPINASKYVFANERVCLPEESTNLLAAIRDFSSRLRS